MTVDVVALRRDVEVAMSAAGIDETGVTTTEPFHETRRDLDHRRDAGYHAGMSFTFRNPARSTSPKRLLRNATSIVVGAMVYRETPETVPYGAARVAAYAQRDYYAALRAGLDAGAAELNDAGFRTSVVVDSNGLVDRAAAYRAGIGWWGRNANLLIPGVGSWFVVGGIVTDASLPVNDEPRSDGCRTCTRCVSACPTGAIVDDGVIDARRCLAWILQDTGVFPRAYRALLGDRIYGCDDCQDVCPPGRQTATTPVTIGRFETGVRPTAGDRESWVAVRDLLELSDDELLQRFGRWYIPRREPRYLRRNALVVLGNVGRGSDPEHRRLVEAYLVHADGLLRAHAIWTAARLGLPIPGNAVTDPDPRVRAEVAMAPSVPRAA